MDGARSKTGVVATVTNILLTMDYRLVSPGLSQNVFL